MKALIILAILTILLTIEPTSADLGTIQSTCKRTPYYNLCVSTLQADPKSANADVTGLALIMVSVVKAKTTELVGIIRSLKGSRPDLRKALDQCDQAYSTGILVADVPVAEEALTKGNPKFAETGMNDAANEALGCEGDFKPAKSPFTDKNTALHDVSAIAAAITRLLL
ncbi:hypothetical protein RJ639_037941 [Escallonia herrerae]|uniref:Pectinesterase inhibitor domain-containing protein n=1 Tax=Escallonia herrerae TaxID=1293975 RepID=A0AA89B4Z4_9ASTE|nr:hypothetical protein RJ639_037941 [Escallonia herrerae]